MATLTAGAASWRLLYVVNFSYEYVYLCTVFQTANVLTLPQKRPFLQDLEPTLWRASSGLKLL